MFSAIALDKQGTRNGSPYRYASISSIRKATQLPLCKNGLVLHHVYGYTDSNEYIITVLRHSTNQYIASASPLPRSLDPQSHKGNKTLLCRTHMEGMLGIVTEDDDDGESKASSNEFHPPS